MNDKSSNLQVRTKSFALNVIRLFSSLPKIPEAQILGRQLLRSGTSVGAHYREGTRARSDAEFICKIELGLQELEETAYWLDLLADSGIGIREDIISLRHEAEQLLAMMVSSVKTVKARLEKDKRPQQQ